MIVIHGLGRMATDAEATTTYTKPTIDRTLYTAPTTETQPVATQPVISTTDTSKTIAPSTTDQIIQAATAPTPAPTATLVPAYSYSPPTATTAVVTTSPTPAPKPTSQETQVVQQTALLPQPSTEAPTMAIVQNPDGSGGGSYTPTYAKAVPTSTIYQAAAEPSPTATTPTITTAFPVNQPPPSPPTSYPTAPTTQPVTVAPAQTEASSSGTPPDMSTAMQIGPPAQMVPQAVVGLSTTGKVAIGIGILVALGLAIRHFSR